MKTLALALAIVAGLGIGFGVKHVRAAYPVWTACGPTNYDPVCVSGTWTVINYNSLPAASSSRVASPSRTNAPSWNPYTAPVAQTPAPTIAPVAPIVALVRYFFTPTRGPF